MSILITEKNQTRLGRPKTRIGHLLTTNQTMLLPTSKFPTCPRERNTFTDFTLTATQAGRPSPAT